MDQKKVDPSQVPTFKQAATTANLPARVKVESLVGKSIVILDWEPDKATLPETGEETEGFLVQCFREDDDELVEWFCGQVALLKALRALKPPFKTTIRKEGRTYLFS